MNKWLATALLTVPLIASAAGPGDESMDRHLDKRLDHMQQRLELNDEQVGELRGIFREHGQELKTLRQSMKEDVKAVLTPEQQEKLDKLQAERKAKWEKKRRGHHKTEPKP